MILLLGKEQSCARLSGGRYRRVTTSAEVPRHRPANQKKETSNEIEIVVAKRRDGATPPRSEATPGCPLTHKVEGKGSRPARTPHAAEHERRGAEAPPTSKKEVPPPSHSSEATKR